MPKQYIFERTETVLFNRVHFRYGIYLAFFLIFLNIRNKNQFSRNFAYYSLVLIFILFDLENIYIFVHNIVRSQY